MSQKELSLECVGFQNLGLFFGEEVKIIKGIELYAKPSFVYVLNEFDKHISLCMEFKKSYFDPDLPPRYIVTSMNKADMLCGDAALLRVRDGLVLTGMEIGEYRWV